MLGQVEPKGPGIYPLPNLETLLYVGLMSFVVLVLAGRYLFRAPLPMLTVRSLIVSLIGVNGYNFLVPQELGWATAFIGITIVVGLFVEWRERNTPIC